MTDLENKMISIIHSHTDIDNNNIKEIMIAQTCALIAQQHAEDLAIAYQLWLEEKHGQGKKYVITKSHKELYQQFLKETGK